MESVEVSRPFDVHHVVSLKLNRQTGKIEGVPQQVLQAIEKAGLKEDEILANPMILQPLLAEIPLEDAAMNISNPYSFSHNIHITFNKETGKFEGIPEEVRQAILSAGLKEDDVMKNPELARDILYKLSLHDVLKYGVESPEISKPTSMTHLVSVRFNKDTGKFEGIPENIVKILESKGLTIEQCAQNPSLANFLYDMNPDDLLPPKKMEISAPTDAVHLFAIRMNKETGKLEGIPDVVRKAFEDAGLTEEQVLSNPSLATDILAKFNVDDVFGREKVKNISGPTNVAHRLSITINPHTGKFEGVPMAVMKFITERGLTVEQIVADTNLATYILEQIEKEGILKDVPNIIDISNPTSFVHNFAITVNKETGKLEGIPDVVRAEFEKAGLTEEQVLANPSLATDILSKFALDDFKPKLKVSDPTACKHNISIKFNTETGKFEGIPEEVRKAVLDAGLTEEQVMKNPELAIDILYKLSLEDVLKGQAK